MKIPLIIAGLIISNYISAQVDSVDKFNAKYLNWYNLDLTNDNIFGTSTDKTYEELLKDKRTKKTIIVAVIDAGVDIRHEDFVGKIWINEDEIPNNNIDDDQNGYIDDINGWNFLGNKSGENIYDENFEYTRLYKLYLKNKNDSDTVLLKVKDIYEKELEKQIKEKEDIEKFEEKYNKSKSIIKSKTGIEVSCLKDLSLIKSDNSQVLEAKKKLKSRYSKGFKEEYIQNWKESNNEYLDKYLNIDFNPREIAKDNPLDIKDTQYGNPDVTGPCSSHGTSVAGVIAAIRNNDLGIDGIASDVKIMALRAVPNGDERDKDIALSIKYAVDNGADIINCSFGKDFSPQKQFVDEAVKYAEEKGVLIVHASGNSGINVDKEKNYPNDTYLNDVEVTNWINVGATSSIKKGKEIPTNFSNYGQKHVDIFAPGKNIISLDTNNTYNISQGTSLAAPIVTGIAALILSYYPELTTTELINILLQTACKVDKPKVLIPCTSCKKRKKVRFSTLSKSGGIINVYNAMLKLHNQNKDTD